MKAHYNGGWNIVMLAYIIQGLGYGFTAAVQPGPFQTYIISQTLNNGWKRTLLAIFAPLISDGPIIILMLVILSNLPTGMMQILQIVGGVFVLYLALDAFKAWRTYDASVLTTSHTIQQSVFKAALMNMLSPGPYIYWSLVTGPILLTGWQESPANGIGFLFGFYAAMITTIAGIIMLFGSARQLGPKVTRMLLGLSAVALLGFGLYQLWAGLSAFVTQF
jgi:threonine/homoserine/homoserine lactone efflux protein